MTEKEDLKAEELENQLNQKENQSKTQEEPATKEEEGVEESPVDASTEDAAIEQDKPQDPIESTEATPVVEEIVEEVAEAAPVVEEIVEEVVEAAPMVEEIAEEVAEAAPVVEEIVEEVAEAAPVVEEVVEEVVEAAPVVEEIVEEVVEAAPVVEEIAEEVAEAAPVVEEIVEEVAEAAPVVEEIAEEIVEAAPMVEEIAEAAPIVEEIVEEVAEAAPVVDEIVEEVAEAAPEVEEKSTVEELPPLGVDYSNSSKAELVFSLRQLLDRRTIQEIRKDVENIKSAFYKKHRIEIEEKRKSFIENGGAPEEFLLPPDPLEEVYKELFESYRIRRTEYYKILEEEKGTNLLKKKDIINKIEALINSQESLNKTFNEFRDLQREWRDIGPVPQSSLRQLWENYHYHVEKFYDFIKINKELRDLDLKKNLEIKLGLCEKAEDLLLEPSVIKAFKDLQDLHARWRETGPVPLEKKDEIWDRFKEATTKINKSHQDHFQQLKGEQKSNLDAKIRLCEQIEDILQQGVNSPNKWNEYSRKVVDLQKMWRTIGFAPKRENNKVYDRFRAGCDSFFNLKREYFNKHRDVQNTNMQLKNELCIQAESLMNSNEWKQATEDLINVQKEWKKIGPVPRKYSDALWKRFRSSCDTFFQRKNDHFKGQGSEQVENLNRKKEIIELVKNYELGEDHNKDLMKLQQFQKDFLSVGHVPYNQKESLVKDFREAVNSLFDKLDIDESKRDILKFRQKIDNLAQSPNNRNRLETEREKLVTKLKQLESDVILWENNIGFFAKSKKSDSLKIEIDKKISLAKDHINGLKDKLSIIDNFDY